MSVRVQFWSVSSLEVLNLNHTMLQWLPASVGRLKKLRLLSLNGNSLRTLPHTLSFCTKLEELNLEENDFYCLPGFVVLLPELKSLRRYGNPRLHSAASDLASSRWRGFVSTHHEGMGRRNTGVPFSEEELVTPLAILAVQSIMVSKIDYWSNSGSIAPAVCRTLDLAQMEYRICDHCFTARHERIKGIHLPGQNSWSTCVIFCSLWLTSLRNHTSSLEGATKLKFAPFCSP